MVETAQSIDRELPRKLQNREYRKRFFLMEASARIAAQLIALRKRRGVNQGQLAQMIGTKQPAISRIERADYQNWNLSTLRKIADVLDARIRVVIEPLEDIIHDYQENNITLKNDSLEMHLQPPKDKVEDATFDIAAVGGWKLSASLIAHSTQ